MAVASCNVAYFIFVIGRVQCKCRERLGCSWRCDGEAGHSQSYRAEVQLHVLMVLLKPWGGVELMADGATLEVWVTVQRNRRIWGVRKLLEH